MTTNYKQSYNRDVFHGGDLTWARETFGEDGLPWIDLSTGINPFAYPLKALPADIWTRLPSASLENKLLMAARTYYQLPEDRAIVSCPGTQSALQHLPRLKPASTVAILSPTYGEHAKCWKAAGHQVIEVESLKDIPLTAEIVVAVSPNNPTGTTITAAALDALHQDLRKRDGLLIIDEAFMDTTPDLSYAPSLPETGVLILKSFGKFFGLAGVRLGFVAGDKKLVLQLRDRLGPWAVSGPAAYMGITALTDHHWARKMCIRLEEERQQLAALLTRSGLPIEGSTPLFTLVKTNKAAALFEHLCRQHILTRPFPEIPSYLRFGLPGTAEHWDRLRQTLPRFSL